MVPCRIGEGVKVYLTAAFYTMVECDGDVEECALVLKFGPALAPVKE